jgi:cysteine synthase A
VVTIATDGFDRYPSVLSELAKRKPMTAEMALHESFEAIFRGGSYADILDVRPRQEKERLFRYKQETWSRFGYSDSYLEGMKSQAFWEGEAAKIPEFDSALLNARRS